MFKIALIFPGQGSQNRNMGKWFYDNFTIAKQTFENASDILGINLQKVCFDSSLVELSKTEITQPSVLVTSVAIFKVYMEQIGIIPEISAGHSLGEISALTCSGAIKFEDAVKLVKNRAALMQEAVPIGLGSMAAIIGLDADVIADECNKLFEQGHVVSISNYNTKNQIIISGQNSAIEMACMKFKVIGGRVVKLNVSAPFHSILMESATTKFKEELKLYKYLELKWPVISNIDAMPYMNSNEIADRLMKHIIMPVRWYDSIVQIQNKHVDAIVEIGPNSVLKNMIKQEIVDPKVYSYDEDNDRDSLYNQLLESKNIKRMIKGPELLDLMEKCLATAICIKNNNIDYEEYTKGVIMPCRSIKSLYYKIKNENKHPSINDLYESLDMLYSVLETKKVTEAEKIIRIKQVLLD